MLLYERWVDGYYGIRLVLLNNLTYSTLHEHIYNTIPRHGTFFVTGTDIRTIDEYDIPGT